jgi:putative ABC transport system ATP-binding protein
MDQRTLTADAGIGRNSGARSAALTLVSERGTVEGSDRLTFDKPGPSPRAALLSLRDVRKSYTSASGEVSEVLKGLSLDIELGSFNVIRGESGSGKTSLLRILGMLDTDFDGDYLFAGDSIKAKPDWYLDELRSNNVGFIFQDGQLFAHLAVLENIMVPVRLQGSADQRRTVRSRIATLAPKFFTAKELDDDILSSRPNQVSGGQKQRAAIMRAFINQPAIILADEPTASLDEDRKQEVLNSLVSLQEAGHTVIVVSHDKVFYQIGRQLELSRGILREPTASLDEDRKQEVLNSLASLQEAGHTVILVSQDKAFHEIGRQLELSRGPSHEPAPDVLKPAPELGVRMPEKGAAIFYGWLPRAPFPILLGQAIRETFLRPLFLFLVLVSLCVGVCQIGVFSSIIVGAQTFLNDAMTKGSRLNRLEVRPRTGDLDKADRFPALDAIRSWGSIQAIVPRRATLVRVFGADGEKTVYSAMGLQSGDPEYRLLTFVAGGPFSPGDDELEVVVTVALLPDLFDDAAGLADGTKKYSDFIGRPVTIEVPQFAPTGQELPARARKVHLKLAGIILFAEGGRQLYLPNRTQLVFDRYKMDRSGTVEIPTTASGDAWADRGAIEALAAFPWEDQLHVYAKEIRDIIPVFQQLSQLGYKPASDIWNFKWVLDVRDLAWNIFIPLLVLIILAVGLTVATNLFSSAKLREREFALWRILGMRRGDLVITQVISTVLMVVVGTVLGLMIGGLLVDGARSFLADQNPGGGLERVFAPVSQFYAAIVLSSIVVGIVSAIYPAVRTARADPAKVLQS